MVDHINNNPLDNRLINLRWTNYSENNRNITTTNEHMGVKLNEEQREAVKSSLKEPFTVITGPPGTGKSQVVLNLLANIAYNEKQFYFRAKIIKPLIQ